MAIEHRVIVMFSDSGVPRRVTVSDEDDGCVGVSTAMLKRLDRCDGAESVNLAVEESTEASSTVETRHLMMCVDLDVLEHELVVMVVRPVVAAGHSG